MTSNRPAVATMIVYKNQVAKSRRGNEMAEDASAPVIPSGIV